MVVHSRCTQGCALTGGDLFACCLWPWWLSMFFVAHSSTGEAVGCLVLSSWFYSFIERKECLISSACSWIDLTQVIHQSTAFIWLVISVTLDQLLP